MKKILIAGHGYVGKAFAGMMARRYDVFVKDPHVEKGQKIAENITGVDTLEGKYDLVIIAVPTPTRESDGACDTSIVESVIEGLDKDNLILIKSTIEPGTTDRLKETYDKRIVFSPEYVGEGKYHVSPRMDFQTDPVKTPFMIAGGDPEDVQAVFDLFVPIIGPEKRLRSMKAKEAELVKYMENTYFGVKVTFANEMYEVIKAHGADWYNVWQAWSEDPRVDVMHTAIFPDARGFSGKCLPKDLNGLVRSSLKHGYRPDFLIEMLKSNARFRPDEPVRVKLEE